MLLAAFERRHGRRRGQVGPQEARNGGVDESGGHNREALLLVHPPKLPRQTQGQDKVREGVPGQERQAKPGPPEHTGTKLPGDARLAGQNDEDLGVRVDHGKLHGARKVSERRRDSRGDVRVLPGPVHQSAGHRRSGAPLEGSALLWEDGPPDLELQRPHDVPIPSSGLHPPRALVQRGVRPGPVAPRS